MIHRMGEFTPKGTPKPVEVEFDAEALIAAVENVCGVSKEEFCGKSKGARVIAAKEILIVSGRRLGASATMLSRLTGLDTANVSRRHDSGIRKMKEDRTLDSTVAQVIAYYLGENRESSISQA